MDMVKPSQSMEYVELLEINCLMYKHTSTFCSQICCAIFNNQGTEREVVRKLGCHKVMKI